MNENEILEAIKKVELREGKERTIKSYVLRDNTLDENEKEIVLSNFGKYGLAFEDKLSDPKTFFDVEKPVVIEIGFGMGKATCQIARDRNEYNYLGIEVYLKGYVRLMRDASKASLDNLKLLRFNATDVLEHMIKDGTVSGFHIFFPDPWMKKRHHKRRLIQKDFVSILSRKLEKGGYIYLVTDWREYAEEMLEILSAEETLKNPYGGFSSHMEWREETKFERKGLERDYKISELWFVKK